MFSWFITSDSACKLSLVLCHVCVCVCVYYAWSDTDRTNSTIMTVSTHNHWLLHMQLFLVVLYKLYNCFTHSGCESSTSVMISSGILNHCGSSPLACSTSGSTSKAPRVSGGCQPNHSQIWFKKQWDKLFLTDSCVDYFCLWKLVSQSLRWWTSHYRPYPSRTVQCYQFHTWVWQYYCHNSAHFPALFEVPYSF